MEQQKFEKSPARHILQFTAGDASESGVVSYGR
jgi:hypothetical protein